LILISSILIFIILSFIIFIYIFVYLSETMHSSGPVPELAVQLIYICGPWARKIKTI